MDKEFNRALDDFLNERMGAAAAGLREKNERYGSAVREYSELVQKAKHNEITDYRQAFDRLTELGEYIRDLECRFYFYTGMAMHGKINDAVSSFALPESLTE